MRGNEKFGLGIIIFLVILMVSGVIGLMGFDTVDASHKGVKIRIGEPKGTMEPGMEWTGLFTKVNQYDLRVRKMTVTMEGNNGAVDKDGQSVYATIEVNYKLNPLNVERAYSEIGLDKNLADTLRIEGIVKEGFKTITSQYSSIEIFQKRQEVKEKAIAQIQSKFPQDFFTLENVIISNIDFNPAFKAAIEQKKVAEELAKAKEQEVNVFKFEADKQIETARGLAESKKLNAEAVAYETKTLAEAEAYALSIKAKELTPGMIQNNYIDAWRAGGSQVPTFIMGTNSNVMPILNIDQMSNNSIMG